MLDATDVRRAIHALPTLTNSQLGELCRLLGVDFKARKAVLMERIAHSLLDRAIAGPDA